MSHDLVVFVRLNGMDPTAIRVSPYTTVQTLQTYLPDSVEADFYLDREQLHPSFTLAFCGVTDHSLIDIVTRELRSAEMDQGPKSPPAPPVPPRLADAFYNHIEGTTRSYRKLVNRFMSMGKPPRKRDRSEKQTAVPRRPLDPRGLELPLFC
jgi:hypothetical protein